MGEKMMLKIAHNIVAIVYNGNRFARNWKNYSRKKSAMIHQLFRKHINNKVRVTDYYTTPIKVWERITYKTLKLAQN